LTDLPLTEAGEHDACRLYQRLTGLGFAQAFTSTLQRASRTCGLADFGEVAGANDDLVEWNYGDYEGLKTVEIDQRSLGWQLFRDGCPGGESVAEITIRANRVVQQMRSIDGNLLLFSHGHFLSVLAAVWLGTGIAAHV
jgi:probable phosphoglycerate mutase